MVDYFCNMNYESLMFSLIVVKVCKSKANRQLFCSYVCSTMCCSHHMPGAHKASTTEMTACNYNLRLFGNENQTQVGKKIIFCSKFKLLLCTFDFVIGKKCNLPRIFSK